MKSPTLVKFTCRRCTFTSTARIHLARAPRKDQASSEARDVETLLSHVECPRCGHIERPFRPIPAAKWVLLAWVAAIGSCVEGLDGDSMWFVASVASLAVAALFFWRGMNEAALIRDSRVEFSSDPLPVDQLAGCFCGVCSQRIVTSEAGAWCSTCGAPSHRKLCAERHAVSVHGIGGEGPFRAISKE